MSANRVPKALFLTKGVGVHREKLGSFEEALRDAKIACYNLVKVSSIFPPHCKIMGRDKGVANLKPGEITFCVMSENSTDEPGRIISASVGIALPKDKNNFGYLSEHHSFGQEAKHAGDYAEDLAASMLASTLGIKFDVDQDWNERKGIWKMRDEIVRSKSITQSAKGDSKGRWTTVIAAAVFCEYH
ncbi:MAG: arginine decarboxylase, pyruvoyl-dependent [Candidatus Muiribacterium halophilum]|uniref:Pyruvoyl-dependent arginine decarboxylase AaxB n=1 Tax=Muiribacterium halophilum TaxID=2053465 RepID=A0A2N5ZAS9_MUIH1|nr:MAG: arginine decarboxylase, pyruvoyl-dependent [Candidatus Muirbacterium halophilum]